MRSPRDRRSAPGSRVRPRSARRVIQSVVAWTTSLRPRASKTRSGLPTATVPAGPVSVTAPALSDDALIGSLNVTSTWSTAVPTLPEGVDATIVGAVVSMVKLAV